MYMLDTLIVAVVMCVDTCNWKMKQRFEYAALQIEIQQSVKRGIYEVQDKNKRTFYWHAKEIITYYKERKHEKIGN